MVVVVVVVVFDDFDDDDDQDFYSAKDNEIASADERKSRALSTELEASSSEVFRRDK